MLVIVKLADVKPNPFRHIDRYPIDKDKVEALKRSIQETGYWPNMIARQTPEGEIQIAYGHHRLAALRELGYEEVQVVIEDRDDAAMLRVMGNENLPDWKQPTAVMNETVAAAKEFLDAELAKADSWDECPNSFVRALFTGTKGDFLHAKRHGVGYRTILKFLGGNWKQWMVQQALALLQDDAVNREAVETFPEPAHAEAFRKAVKENLDAFPTKKAQLKLAAQVKRELTAAGGELSASGILEEVRTQAGWKRRREKRQTGDVFVDHYSHLDDVEKELAEDDVPKPPWELKGKTDHGHSKFIVFYFDPDQEADYQRILQLFERPSSAKRRAKKPTSTLRLTKKPTAAVPYMDSKALIDFLKKFGAL
jgi:hypothetical protein